MLGLVAAAILAPETFRLWDGRAPYAVGDKPQDIPTITRYMPEAPNGTAVVVFPGGGYGMLADHEGRDYALWLNRLGVTAFVVRYRLGSEGYRHPAMLTDAARAVRWVRSRYPALGKVGIMGSSAGGHLASTLLTHFEPGRSDADDAVERESSRPDFGILCYAVISMGPLGHAGSRENLLGTNPSEALVEELSNERRVTAQTPPTFLWSTGDDAVVPVGNSLAFAAALSAAKVPYELHVYPHGPHGLGLGGAPDSENLLPWTTELRRWLKEITSKK